MSPLDCRDFVRALATAGLAASAPVSAQQPSGRTETTSAATAPAVPPPVTRTLARYLVSARYEDLPKQVRDESARTLLNWVGCAVGGSRHETVDIAIRPLSPFRARAQATVLGRRERMDVMHAALMNGISSHVFDFDDTHLQDRDSPGRTGGLGDPRARGVSAA